MMFGSHTFGHGTRHEKGEGPKDPMTDTKTPHDITDAHHMFPAFTCGSEYSSVAVGVAPS